MTPSPMSAHSTDLSTRLVHRIDELWPRYQDVLRDLVRIPSELGTEAAAQRFLADRAREAGLQVEMWDVDPVALQIDDRFAPVDGGDRPRPNVTAILPGAGPGSIAVAGHIDVVSPQPLSAWTRDPWGGEIDGDRVYGRGALDMKGGLVAGLLAVHAIADIEPRHRPTVVFESVIEEECSGNGTLAARRRGPAVDAALIPEITGEHVQIANTGVLWFELTVTGKPAYVGLAGASVNAIDVAARLVGALQALPVELNALPRHPVYADYPAPYTLNVGTISGGDWPSNVPLECRIGCRLSFPPDWDVRRAQEFVQHRITDLAARDRWLAEAPPALHWNGFRAHGYVIDMDHPLVATVRAAAEAATGRAAPVSPMFGTADARYFADDGIPAVYYGPSGGGMHAPDEWVSLSSVRRVAEVLSRTIATWRG